MKVLIWVGAGLLCTLVNLLLGVLFGFRAGYLLLYIATFYIAKRLCKSWDRYWGRYQFDKKLNQSGMRPVEYVKSHVNPLVLDELEASRGNASFLRSKLEQNVAEGYLTQYDAEILAKEYMHGKPYDREQ